MGDKLYALTLNELSARLEMDGIKPVHAASLFRFIHRQSACRTSVGELSPPVVRWLQEAGRSHWLGDPQGGAAPCRELELVAQTRSQDGKTDKYLVRLSDGQEVETVTMGYPGRFTACLSTQAGCAMGCVFCATGQMGFVRHLDVSEIVAQVRLAQRALSTSNDALRNIVLMGMGEPLHNYDNVMRALEILCDPRGVAMPPRHITINTVGVVPGILRLANERRPYHLGVSLHAANDADREALVPINRRWPLLELIEACRTYNRLTKKRVFFAWTLIAGVNDEPAGADRLVELLRGIDAHVNLIRLNRTSGYAGSESTSDRAEAFSARLRQQGLPCTIRQRRGIDVTAGCGQLTAERQLLKSRRAIPSLAP